MKREDNMTGIQGLRVDGSTYSGEVNIVSDYPQIHLILSADTQFLDRAFMALTQNSDYFTIEGKSHRNKKIGFIRKQDGLVDGLTVAENIFFPNKHGIFLSRQGMSKTCEDMFEEIGYYLPPNAQVSDLTASQRKFVEFYQIYLRKPDFLVANEVTANLSYKEIIYFTRIIEKLKQQGTSSYFFMTRCEDALRIGDVFHVYVDGELRCNLTKKEAQANPEKLILSVMNIATKSNEDDNERQWLQIISDSLQIDDQLVRVNMVLSAYCTRICKILDGQFCRLYIYQQQDDEITCVSSSEEVRPGFGHLKEAEMRSIIKGEPLFFATDRSHGYAELFEDAEYPRGIICYSMNAMEGNRLMIQSGMESPPKYIDSDHMDQIQRIAIELLIFMENSQLHRQTAILQEGNHRIKNNMQMILSYLMLQQQALLNSVTNEEDRKKIEQAFSDLTNRIMTVHNVHNLFSALGTQNTTADFQELLEETKKIYEGHLDVALQSEGIDIPQKLQTPLCIILNELMNNTVKHNKQPGRVLHAQIRIVQQDEIAQLSYRDDGVGCNKDTSKQSSGIGVRLITMLVRNDLKGEIQISKNKGYSVEIKFPLRKTK